MVADLAAFLHAELPMRRRKRCQPMLASATQAQQHSARAQLPRMHDGSRWLLVPKAYILFLCIVRCPDSPLMLQLTDIYGLNRLAVHAEGDFVTVADSAQQEHHDVQAVPLT